MKSFRKGEILYWGDERCQIMSDAVEVHSRSTGPGIHDGLIRVCKILIFRGARIIHVRQEDLHERPYSEMVKEMKKAYDETQKSDRIFNIKKATFLDNEPSYAKYAKELQYAKELIEEGSQQAQKIGRKTK